MTAVQTYEESLQTLSEASVHQHFDAFLDIDWDNPEFTIHKNDPRWVLPAVDPLGSHPWYQSQSLERQIEIGLWRQANVVKTGLQFEQVLIAGLMQYVFKLPQGSPEFRYCTHEATEECHHTQMFQEFVNRAGQDVPGMPLTLRLAAPLIPIVASVLPEVFFTMVLAGEEPIDHVQKSILRAGGELHPLLERIMQIHIAEEARHIGFAHRYMQETVPHLSAPRKLVLAALFPVIMRVACDAIVIPGPEMTEQVGVPRWVLREVYWDRPESQKMLRDLLADVRMLVEDTGLMNPISRQIWKVLKISGRPSRFRSEPQAV